MQNLTIEPMAANPSPKIPAKLGFGRCFTDRMFTQRYTVERGWQDPSIGPYRALAGMARKNREGTVRDLAQMV